MWPSPSYLIEGKGDAVINAGYSGLHEIEYDQTSKKYIFWVRTYFDGLRMPLITILMDWKQVRKICRNLKTH
jgi:hypothetical protein